MWFKLTYMKIMKKKKDAKIKGLKNKKICFNSKLVYGDISLNHKRTCNNSINLMFKGQS